uniref:phosphoribosylformylglycinamidine cyclo-ligase n=2 Tax=Brassica oleracea var. oleracea TaxID=109376 RepID=A0A0D3DT77_BRAOL
GFGFKTLFFFLIYFCFGFRHKLCSVLFRRRLNITMEARLLQSSSSTCFFSSGSCSINRHRFSAIPSSPKPLSVSFPQKTRTRTNGVLMSKKDDGIESLSYKGSGVDIDAGTELVRRIAKMAPGIGGFGGLFPLGDSYLVAGTDGVGTKLKLAFETGIHHTIGIDLVAMSVNDIVTSGAKPLFFLDYFATSRLDVDLAEKVIKGIVDGCGQSDCALLGGETAEMPDFYAEGEYDLSGFAVGIVKKDSVINGKNIVAGDVLIGLPSSGVHSNGFSLVRKVVARSGLSLKDELPGGSTTLGEALMAPTVIYVKQVLDIISRGGVKGIAHITGGGFTDNIPRVFPDGLGAVIHTDAWELPPLFKWIQQSGRIEDSEMRRTFNLGIGMVMMVSPEAALRILGEAKNGDYVAHRIGEVINGEGVTYQ